MAMKVIFYYRNCIVESALVTDFVTFHLYFPTDNMPETLGEFCYLVRVGLWRFNGTKISSLIYFKLYQQISVKRHKPTTTK